ncbi:hypothetical protein [Candidatus Hamiltonella defensa]|uniref:hypothetical protein n=1 Tax=Candidatus Williamhamiltonella defendens TaxID=138072 RepID=UPI00158313BB|nr:hypothetical protein [Candidatus Hamiltonella defensa]
MRYTSDLRDTHREIISGNFKYGNDGNRSKYEKRAVVNAGFAISKTGTGEICQNAGHLGKPFIAFLEEQKTKEFGKKGNMMW